MESANYYGLGCHDLPCQNHLCPDITKYRGSPNCMPDTYRQHQLLAKVVTCYGYWCWERSISTCITAQLYRKAIEKGS